MKKEGDRSKMAAQMRLILWDFTLCFMYAWAGCLVKLFVYSFLGSGQTAETEALKLSLSILYTYLFEWLCKLSNGGAYNPLTVIYSASSYGLRDFTFIAFGRIPAQIAGSVTGVLLLKLAFPQVGHGPSLNVDFHRGAMVEGMLTFVIVMVMLVLKKKRPKSFYTKTWISTLLKMSLNVLGADFTGGVMNPAFAIGWAFARGEHVTREHLMVYWFAPVQATLLAVLVFKLFAGAGKKNEQQQQPQQEAEEQKFKSE